MKKRTILLVIMGLIDTQESFAEAIEVQTLSPITVTATRMKTPLYSVPAAVTVISAEDIRIQQPMDFAEVLNKCVGLHVQNWGPLGMLSTANIRGSTAGQVLVLLDGQRLNSAQSGDFNLSDLPIAIEDIEQIEIIRGPASALYGQGAMAGVVHIKTHLGHRTAADTQGKIAVMGARDKTLDTSLALSGTHRAFDFHTSANGNTSEGYRVNSKHLAGRVAGQAGLLISEQHHLDLGIFFLQKRSGIPGHRDFPQPRDMQYEQSLRLTSQLQNEILGSLILTKVGYSHLKRRFQDFNATLVMKESRHVLDSINLESQWEKNWGHHRVTIGADVSLDYLNSTDAGKRQQSQHSIFLLDHLKLWHQLDISPAFRWDAHSDYGSQFSPRCLMAYQVTTNIRLRGGMGRAYQAPTLNDRFWPDDGVTVGNSQLTTEKSWEYETGLDLRFGHWGEISIGVFQRQVYDLIEWTADREGKWKPFNIGKASIRGLEVEATSHPFSWLRFSVNFTHLQPKNRLDGYELLNRSRNKIAFWGLIHPGGGFSFSAGGQYLDLVPDSRRIKNQFYVFDAGARFRSNASTSWRWEIACKVTNFMNETYEIFSGYPMPPFTPQVTFSAEL